MIYSKSSLYYDIACKKALSSGAAEHYYSRIRYSAAVRSGPALNIPDTKPHCV